MARHKLTDLQVKNAKQGRLSDGGGLYLDTKPGGAKAWVLRIMVKGKVMERGLGSFPQVALKQARDKSEEWADEIRCGRDPRTTAFEVKPVRTLKDCALDYILANEPTWKNEVHKNQWRSTLATYVYPTIGKKPVDQVDKADVLAILKPMRRPNMHTMHRAIVWRLQRRIGGVLMFARSIAGGSQRGT